MERSFLIILLLSSANAYFLSEEECLDYTIYPVQYDITIYPYLYDVRSFAYDCDLSITFIVNGNIVTRKPVTVIELDAMELEIYDKSIEVFEGNEQNNLVDSNRHYEFDKVRGKVYIYLKYALKEYRLSKTQYHLKMRFRKYLKNDSKGVFMGMQKYDEQGSVNHMVVTRLSPNKAKYFLPCFDNPRFEAVFKFKVYLRPPPDGMKATNTSLVIAKEQRVTTFKDGVILIEYIPSPQVALHQLGFHVSPFKNRLVIAKNTNDSLVIWAPETTLGYYTYVLNFGQMIINLIHDYASVNIPLVYGPINIVPVPVDITGYEVDSWNLLTNKLTRLQYIQEYTSIRQVEAMKFELAQQLCRIFLGNPGEIGRTRWKEEWFKEGMATYLSYYFLAQYNHGVDSTTQRWPLDYYGIEMRHKAMEADWYHSKALITFNRTLAIEIPERYKQLVTMKTASILWMVENWLGSEKFHQALIKYINTRRGKFISFEDFTADLDKNTVECLHQFFNGSTASKVLHSWFSRPGYPVVNVEVLRDRPLNAIILKQRQFSFTQEGRDESDYLIPVSYMVQNNDNCFNCYRPRFTIGMYSYTFEENLNGGWIILNRNASGYYRVNYDVETWRLIAKALKTDPLSIDDLNRAQIVNDVFALYTAGDLDYYLALEILNYLDRENSYIVWQSAISGFELLKTKNASCKMSKAVYEQWQNFLRNKLLAVYSRLFRGTEEMGRLFRSTIIQFACGINHEKCLENIRRMHDTRINPDYREAYYYMAINENRGNVRTGENMFEAEDFKLAEHRMMAELKFLRSIPMGRPMPERIIAEPIISTEPAPLVAQNLTAPTEKPSSSVMNMASILIMTISILITSTLS